MEDRFLIQSLRVAFVICLYFLTLACYLTPILVTKYWGSKTQLITSPNRAVRNKQLGFRIISWCNCTATGIFLAMCFLGLFPYVEEKFHSIIRKLDYDIMFPIAECVIVLGFVLTLLLEQVILTWREQKEASLRDDPEQNQGLLEECEMQDLSDDPSGLRDEHEEHEQRLVEGKPLQHSNFSGDDPNVDVISVSNNIDQSHNSHFVMLMHRGSAFSFFILALATGLHSMFVGITLGLQTNSSKAVHLFIAIITHECLVAAALGINSTRLKYSFMSYFKFASLYSAAIPLGVVIGAAIERAPGTAGDVISAILQGLAAGTFLHVTFQEFIPSEFSNRQDRILKVLFVALGFIIIAVVTFFIS